MRVGWSKRQAFRSIAVSRQPHTNEPSCHQPETTLLHQIIREYWPEFQAKLSYIGRRRTVDVLALVITLWSPQGDLTGATG